MKKNAKATMLAVVLGSLLAAAGAAAVAGCGGDSTTTSSSATGGAGGGGGAQSGGGGAGGAASPSCVPTYKCQQAIMPPGNDPTKLCSGTVAGMKFGILQSCLCTGPCATKCASSVCAQQMPSIDCLTCLMDITAGCGKEANDCAAN